MKLRKRRRKKKNKRVQGAFQIAFVTDSYIVLRSFFVHQPIVEAKLHDESRLIQRCFDDNKDDDKKLKGQSKNEFKIQEES